MILEISVAIIALFAVIFVVGMLITLVQIRKTAAEAARLMETSRQHIVPLSHDLTIVVHDLKKIIQSIQKQIGMVEHGVGEITETIVRLNRFEKVLQEKLEPPIMEFATLVSAISRVLRAFLDLWKKK
ncbi:MAG TPA: DUF948 domain-containing protein [bacterium]|nr:DUF948 domain-containing protein [bacterium]